MKTVFAWEPSGDRRLTGIRYEDSAANVVAQFGYGYQLPNTTNDPTAQIRQWTQWHRGLGGTAATQAKKWDFRYDAVDQLAEAAKAPVGGGPVESSLGYGYDPAGNRNQVLENGVAQEFTVNGKNELTGTAATQSAPVRFAGTVSAASTVTLAGQPATMTNNALAWEKTLTVGTGTNSLVLLATETTPPPGKPAETTRRHVNLTLTAAPPWTFAYDDNGSLLSTNNSQLSTSYEWDAANRLSAIVKDGQRTEFTYDGQSRWTRIVEKDGPTTAAPVLGSRRFVWEGYRIAQIRDYDASDTLTGVRHLFAEGEVRSESLNPQPSSLNLLHLRDHLGSVREVVNTSDLAMRARYDYAPYGQRAKLGGDLDCDFGFTGHYEHAPSGLTLAPFRAYHSGLGRWLSRDPIGESGGLNLYGYVGNGPVGKIDPLGLWSLWNPATWGDGTDWKGWDSVNPIGKSAHWGAMNYDTLGKSAQATLDGIIPFADPFLDNGGYDRCDPALTFSRKAGSLARDFYTLGLGARFYNAVGKGVIGAESWATTSAGQRWLLSRNVLSQFMSLIASDSGPLAVAAVRTGSLIGLIHSGEQSVDFGRRLYDVLTLSDLTKAGVR
jgi:RHS repeat-associated protein